MTVYCLLCLLPLMTPPEPPPPESYDYRAIVAHLVREHDEELSLEERRAWLQVEGDGLDLTNWIGMGR